MRARVAMAMQPTTAIAAAQTRGSSASPRKSADHDNVKNGWVSCTWLPRAIPARARPAYQGTKAPYMLMADTYANPPQASAGTLSMLPVVRSSTP